jgi:hypothetical protein
MSSTQEATKPDGIRLQLKWPKETKIKYKEIKGIEKENIVEKKMMPWRP